MKLRIFCQNTVTFSIQLLTYLDRQEFGFSLFEISDPESIVLEYEPVTPNQSSQLQHAIHQINGFEKIVILANDKFSAPLGMHVDFNELASLSEKYQQVIERGKKFALMDAPLLIYGETGTGKEMLARACHYESQRRHRLFWS